MKCPECYGLGKVRYFTSLAMTMYPKLHGQISPCPDCDGTGEVKEEDDRDE